MAVSMVGASRLQPEQHRLIEASNAGRQYWLDYTLPVAAICAATLLRLAFAPLVGSAAPFVTYFAAAVILAWYRGFWPAAFSIVLSVFAGAYFVLPSIARDQWGHTSGATVAAFTLTSLSVSFLIDFQRRTLLRARSAEETQAAIANENAKLLEQATRSEEALRVANVELRRANRDLETFAYSASHDLKEPLRTISISAELIERRSGLELSGDGANFLRHIRASARRMDALLEDLLTYSRATKVETGSSPPVDASHVLAEVLANLRAQIDGAGAIVTADPLPTVEIHKTSLGQLFQNLISNAIKYRAKESPRVHIAAEQRDGACVFSVVDNGIGIDPQFTEQIFGLFKRLHAYDEFPGSGMGLAICKRVIEQYGGTIWLQQSEPGKGSTFCFSFPKQRASEE